LTSVHDDVRLASFSTRSWIDVVSPERQTIPNRSQYPSDRCTQADELYQKVRASAKTKFMACTSYRIEFTSSTKIPYTASWSGIGQRSGFRRYGGGDLALLGRFGFLCLSWRCG
jgi:hypothetical protein